MLTKLQESFAAIYALLERPRAARRAIIVLLVLHSVLLGYSAYVHSPTLNEPGHLVAGLSHWKFGRFDVYKVNPPLIKMVAAVPVIAVGYNEDWSSFYEAPGARPEFSMGKDFVAANGERSFFLFMIARWACIPFSCLGAIVCYLWGRDLYGQPSGVLACAIWCFEPNILAHASLITPDIGATAIGLAACYTFWRWLKTPTWSQTTLTGVVLGLAELGKTTLILFYPLWPLMWLVYRWLNRRKMNAHDWLRESAMLALRMLIGLCILNLGYGFEGTLTPLNDFQFVSDLFTGKVSDNHPPSSIQHPPSRIPNRTYDTRHPTPSSPIQHPTSNIRYPAPNRFTNTWLGGLPAPFPRNYLLGIDLQQKDFENYGRPSYMRGQWRDCGWWYYYLYASAIKIPLGLWVLGLLTVVLRCVPNLTNEERLSPPSVSQQPSAALAPDPRHGTPAFTDELVLLFPGLVIFAVVSSKTGFSEHLRYVLPSFPFCFIAISQIMRALQKSRLHACNIIHVAMNSAHTPSQNLQTGSGFLTNTNSDVERWQLYRNGDLTFRHWSQRMMLLAPVLVCWFAASSLWIYPHSLSYFNESIGGPLNGPKHLLGSNVDWGQDLRYLNQRFQQIWTDSAADGHWQRGIFYRSHGRHSDGDVIELRFDGVHVSAIVVSVNYVYGNTWISVANGSALEGLTQLPTLAKQLAREPQVRIAYSQFFVDLNAQQEVGDFSSDIGAQH